MLIIVNEKYKTIDNLDDYIRWCESTDEYSNRALPKEGLFFEKADVLPKTIIYSLYKSDDLYIDTLIGSFQCAGVKGYLQHDSAWWFNDNKTGIRDQLTSLASENILGNFVGMLTDSRSFLSYTRHEYFRRILCDLIGELVDKNEYTDDEKALKKYCREHLFL